jgi:arabinogalactan endo-1,4-beta-galactosidase
MMTRLILAFILLNLGCSDINKSNEKNGLSELKYYLGADLSYVNEMEDCGVIYKNKLGNVQDPYLIFSEAGANLVRLRLWHSPSWSNYSNLADVKRSIMRAKAAGMKVLLAFHYSDDWADPYSQDAPADWLHLIDDTDKLSEELYSYTFNVLQDLFSLNLMPDVVQIGNEINAMILQRSGELKPIDWNRNSILINSALMAVRDISEKNNYTIQSMLHIAQPENALWWFKEAKKNGVVDFDFIGISYYPKWSTKNLDELGEAIKVLKNDFQKDIMVVETAYPFTLQGQDEANNILGEDSLEEFPATQDGQLAYLNKLHTLVKDAGGSGVLYWEPAWVSNFCSTRWGKGSHWENAAMFDFKSTPTKALTWYAVLEN